MKKKLSFRRIGAGVLAFSLLLSLAISSAVSARSIASGDLVRSVKNQLVDIGEMQGVAYAAAKCLTMEEKVSFNVFYDAIGVGFKASVANRDGITPTITLNGSEYDTFTFDAPDDPTGAELKSSDIFDFGKLEVKLDSETAGTIVGAAAGGVLGAGVGYLVGSAVDAEWELVSIDLRDRVQVNINTGPTIQEYFTGVKGDGMLKCYELVGTKGGLFERLAFSMSDRIGTYGDSFVTTVDQILCGIPGDSHNIPGVVDCGGDTEVKDTQQYSFRSKEDIRQTIIGLYNRAIDANGWFEGEYKTHVCLPGESCEGADEKSDLGYFDTIAGYGLYLNDVMGKVSTSDDPTADDYYNGGSCLADSEADAGYAADAMPSMKILKGSIPAEGKLGGRLIGSLKEDPPVQFREYPNDDSDAHSFVNDVKKADGSGTTNTPTCNDLIERANWLASNDSQIDVLDVYAHELNNSCYEAFKRQYDSAVKALGNLTTRVETRINDPNSEIKDWTMQEVQYKERYENAIAEFDSFTNGQGKDSINVTKVRDKSTYEYITIPGGEEDGMGCKDDFQFLVTPVEEKYVQPVDEVIDYNVEPEGCYDNSGAFSWVSCPLIVYLGDFAERFYQEHLEPRLLFDSSLLTYKVTPEDSKTAGKSCNEISQADSNCQLCASDNDMTACEACNQYMFSEGCTPESVNSDIDVDSNGNANVTTSSGSVADISATSNVFSVIRRLWGSVRTIANIVFIIFMVIVIISQVSGLGIDNYNLKKIFPKIAVTAILINASYWICAAGVDLSNILGLAFKSLLQSIGNTILVKNKTGAKQTEIIAALVGVLIAIVAIKGSGFALIFPVIAALISGLICFLLLFVVIYLRLLVIMACIVLSPLAMACYMMPNTKKFFDMWKDTYIKALLCFPLASLLVYGGQLGGRLLYATADSSSKIAPIAAFIVSVAPVLKIRSTIEGSFGVLKGAIAGVSKLQAGASRGVSRGIMGSNVARESKMLHAGKQMERRNLRRAGLYKDKDGNLKDRAHAVDNLDANAGRLARARARGQQLLQRAKTGENGDARLGRFSGYRENQARARMMALSQYAKDGSTAQFTGAGGITNLQQRMSQIDEKNNQVAVESERLAMLNDYSGGNISQMISGNTGAGGTHVNGLKDLITSGNMSASDTRRRNAIIQQLAQDSMGRKELLKMVRGETSGYDASVNYGSMDAGARDEVLKYIARDGGLMSKIEAKDNFAAQYLRDYSTGTYGESYNAGTGTYSNQTFAAGQYGFSDWQGSYQVTRNGAGAVTKASTNQQAAYDKLMDKANSAADLGGTALSDVIHMAQAKTDGYQDLLKIASRADFSGNADNEADIMKALGNMMTTKANASNADHAMFFDTSGALKTGDAYTQAVRDFVAAERGRQKGK